MIRKMKFPVQMELVNQVLVNPAYREEITQKLDETLSEAQKALKGGISPKEYVRISKMVEALQIGKTILKGI